MSEDFSGPLRKPVARKGYACDWCGYVIAAGTKHVAWSGRWEGNFGHLRLHNACFENMQETTRGETWLVGEGREWATEERQKALSDNEKGEISDADAL